jgi:hypothetical protein
MDHRVAQHLIEHVLGEAQLVDETPLAVHLSLEVTMPETDSFSGIKRQSQEYKHDNPVDHLSLLPISVRCKELIYFTT